MSIVYKVILSLFVVIISVMQLCGTISFSVFASLCLAIILTMVIVSVIHKGGEE